MEPRRAVDALDDDGPHRRGHDRRRALGAGQPRGDQRAPARPGRRAPRGPEAEVGEEDWSTVERLVLLRTIDSLWVEHLTELDDMRRGIGLRGYAQQDPLNEFRREAFQLYEELRGLIRHGVASSIFRVTVTRQPAPTPGGDPAVAASLAAGAAALSGGERSGRRQDGRRRRCRCSRTRAQRRLRPCPPPARPARRSSGRPAGGPEDRPGARRSATPPPRPAPGDRWRRGRRRTGPASRPAAHGSGATTRAGAARAPSTRSATGAERPARRNAGTFEPPELQPNHARFRQFPSWR